MKHAKEVLLCAGALALAVACTRAARTGAPLAETQIGLVHTSVFGTPDPIVAKTAGQDPGENQRIGAYFSGSPPIVPHTTREYLPLTAASNECVACHNLKADPKEPAPGQAQTPPIPDTHYAAGAVVRGTHYFCTQCHATQTDAPPLVTNTYLPTGANR